MTVDEVMSLDDRHVPFDHRTDVDLLPKGKRMVVLLNVAVEEWSWEEVESFLPAGTFVLDELDRPSLTMRTTTKYEYEIGFPRILEVLDEHNITTTIVANGSGVERYPDVIQDAFDRGHEICAHGYSEGTPPTLMDRDEQHREIRRNIELIEDVVGERPVGWISPGADCTEETVELLAQEDFLYHGDLHDDELPYFIDTDYGTLVEIPFRLVGMVNDLAINTSWDTRISFDEALEYLKSSFDAAYRESATRPLQFRYAVHPFVSGWPDFANLYSEFLGYMQGYDDVWITSYRGLAEHWDESFSDEYPSP